jgi:mRNA-degrading endonuclease toxin of MazEF toxin-antitoxin module
MGILRKISQRRWLPAIAGRPRRHRYLRCYSRTSCLNQSRNATRLDVEPSPRNGLRQLSQIAIDKITVIPADKIGAVIGRADDALLLRVNRALALFLNIV